MKKNIIITLALLLGITGFSVFAYRYYGFGMMHYGYNNDESDQYYEHMTQMRDLIHSADFNTIDITGGIQTDITSLDKDLVGIINEEMEEHMSDLSDFNSLGIDTQIDNLQNGVSIKMISDNNDVEDYLHKNSNNILRNFFMNQMMDEVHGDDHSIHRGGCMGGW